MAKYYELYKVLLLTSTLSGVYFPSIEKIYGTKWYITLLRFLFILPGTALPLYFVSSLKYQIFDHDEIGNKIYGYVIIIFTSFTTFTFYSFYYYRNDFEKVFQLWDSMFQDELFADDRKKLLSKNIRVTNSWLKIFGSLNILGCVAYFTFTFSNQDKKLTHPSGIPYRYQSPDFELMNTLDLVVCMFGFATLVTSDSMMMVFLSLEEAQLKHLKMSLARILDIVSVTDSGNIQIGTVEVEDIRSNEMKTAFNETVKDVRIWISHHNQIIRFHNELQRIFSVLLSVKFSVFAIFICLVCFLGLTGKFRVAEICLSFVFCCSNYSLFYVNVTFADSIAEVAGTIFGEAFQKNWYLYPRSLRTAFYFIIMRSHRPVKYMAFKIHPLSSKSFLKILSSAYSFFTFMLQVNRRRVEMLDDFTETMRE